MFFDTARHQYTETLQAQLKSQLSLKKRRSVSKTKSTVVNDGHGLRRFKNFATTLDSGFQWGRHHFERKFHDECLKALAETLFGDEWHTYGLETVRERKWDITSKMVIGSAPRRFGKSVSLSKVEAALAQSLLMDTQGLDFTEYHITNFSTGQRASRLLSQYVKKFLKELGLYDYCNVVTDNSEEIVLTNNGMTVTFKFLPSNPDTYVFFCFFFPFLVLVLVLVWFFFSGVRVCVCVFRPTVGRKKMQIGTFLFFGVVFLSQSYITKSTCRLLRTFFFLLHSLRNCGSYQSEIKREKKRRDLDDVAVRIFFERFFVFWLNWARPFFFLSRVFV